MNYECGQVVVVLVDVGQQDGNFRCGKSPGNVPDDFHAVLLVEFCQMAGECSHYYYKQISWNWYGQLLGEFDIDEFFYKHQHHE